MNPTPVNLSRARTCLIGWSWDPSAFAWVRMAFGLTSMGIWIRCSLMSRRHSANWRCVAVKLRGDTGLIGQKDERSRLSALEMSR